MAYATTRQESIIVRFPYLWGIQQSWGERYTQLEAHLMTPEILLRPVPPNYLDWADIYVYTRGTFCEFGSQVEPVWHVSGRTLLEEVTKVGWISPIVDVILAECDSTVAETSRTKANKRRSGRYSKITVYHSPRKRKTPQPASLVLREAFERLRATA